MEYKKMTHLYMAALIVILNGCASHPVAVRSGDKVEAVFTCRLQDGRIAATTQLDEDLAGEKKSPLYLPYHGSETVTLTAGMPPDDPKKDRVSFEDEIMKRLGGSLVGIIEGDHAVVELRAERYPAMSAKDHLVRMALVRKRQKELRLSREEFINRTGKEPEVRQNFITDPLLPGKVSEVTNKEVVVRFVPEKGKPLTSPFGPITVRETPTQYELVINAEKDRLVRTGGMAGRISAVEADSFEIDYGHPFGGEKLQCEVTVDAVKHIENKVAGLSPVSPSMDNNRDNREPAHNAHSNKDTDSSKVLDPKAKRIFDAGLANMLSMSGQSAATGEVVRSGDLVTTNYTLTLEDGTLVTTTLKNAGKNQDVKKSTWYREPAGYAPVELVAGKQEIMPGLGEALVGMKAGEKRHITLTPDKAFGLPDPRKTQQLPCSQSFPKTIRMPLAEYSKRFSSSPIVDTEVELLPYFKSRVTAVTEREVALEFEVTDGASFSDGFGSISVEVADNAITTTLKPLVGAPFPLKDGVGIVSATDGKTFTVDLNHPLAGKTIVLDLEVVSVSAADKSVTIDWIDDYDTGLSQAKKEGKPVFLILHADWCGWCKKTFTEAIPDPRIMALKDRFVWVRGNSDKDQKLKQRFGQEGFPMMVLLKPDGSVLKKIDGYRNARALREEIKAVLN